MISIERHLKQLLLSEGTAVNAERILNRVWDDRGDRGAFLLMGSSRKAKVEGFSTDCLPDNYQLE